MAWCARRGGLGSRSVSEKICSRDASKFCRGAFEREACDCFEASCVRVGSQGGEDPIAFGPDALLRAMCSWQLLVVQEAPSEPIGAGDKIPSGVLTYLDDGELQAYCIHDPVRDKRVVFLGVPGAFTSTYRFTTHTSKLLAVISHVEALLLIPEDYYVTYCLLVDDTIVKIANIEADEALETTTADEIMEDLQADKGS